LVSKSVTLNDLEPTHQRALAFVVAELIVFLCWS